MSFSIPLGRKWAWVVGSFILSGAVVLSFVLPFSALPLSVALIVGGIVAYRQSPDSAIRTLGAAAIAAGIVIVLTIVLVGVGLLGVHTDVRIAEGDLPTP